MCAAVSEGVTKYGRHGVQSRVCVIDWPHLSAHCSLRVLNYQVPSLRPPRLTKSTSDTLTGPPMHQLSRGPSHLARSFPSPTKPLPTIATFRGRSEPCLRRYASYAAVATRSWVKARSFLLRWLHPMDTMFGAAEVILVSRGGALSPGFMTGPVLGPTSSAGP